MSQVSDKYELALDLDLRKTSLYFLSEKDKLSKSKHYKKIHMSKNLLIFGFFRVYNNRNIMFKNLYREREINIPTKTKRHI